MLALLGFTAGCDLVFGLEEPVQGSGGSGGGPTCEGPVVGFGSPSERLVVHESFEGDSCWNGDNTGDPCMNVACTLPNCCGATSGLMTGQLFHRVTPGYSLAPGDVLRIRASGRDPDQTAVARIFVGSVNVNMNLFAELNDESYQIENGAPDLDFGLGNDMSDEPIQLDCASLTHTPAAGVELMPDPSFEMEGSGWSLDGAPFSIKAPSDVRCGGKDLELVCDEGPCVLTQHVCLPTTPGTLSLWLTTSAVSGAATQPVPTRRSEGAASAIDMSSFAGFNNGAGPFEWFTYNDVLTLDGVDDPTSIELRLEVPGGASLRVDCASATFIAD